MTRDTIDRAIKRGSGGDADANYDEVRYEGYGPGGVAVIVEALTNNRNRTAGEVRSSFAKHGGNLGETNSRRPSCSTAWASSAIRSRPARPTR